MKILLIEDNTKISGYLKKVLQQKSYSVDCVFDGESGEIRAMTYEYDVIVLDRMLPVKDGIEVCKNLRSHSVNTPVLMLTALGEISEKIEGLDSGADDYLVKPFSSEELLARIRALLRRPQTQIFDHLVSGDLCIYTEKNEVIQDGKLLSLTLREYSILEYFMRNKNQTLTRDQILEHCWDFAYDACSNIVDVYIKKLRKKITNGEHYITTVRGIGYQFTEK